MTQDKITQSLDAVQAWVESRGYQGYDPGDGLTSFLRPLTLGNLFAERVLQQTIWKAPFNIRPLVGVKPLDSTKGRGFMAAGYLHRYEVTGDATFRARAIACLDWLNRARESGQAGHCWGNHFDFSTRSGRMLAHTPTIVWTSLIGHSFVDAYEVLGDESHLETAESICRWILSLPREKTSSGSCLSYTGVFQNSVHNSNLLGAGVLARTWKHRPRDEYRTVAREAALYSCLRQRADGSWWYGEEPKYHWIDNFHTGYNLDSLKFYADATGDNTVRPHIERGYAYFKATFFEASGRPRYYHNRTYPIDIQCAAQAIDTFCLFADEDPAALAMARKVAAWTISHLQDPDGHFYYRQYPRLIARTPYFHWGQATMFRALSHLLLRLSLSQQSSRQFASNPLAS
jgi:rhamnogalacturonyl hydrolase YesR